MQAIIATVIRIGLVAGIGAYLGKQVKKPSRFVGRFFASLMNASHSGLTDWALTHIQIPANATVLDVGCGGGRTIEKLANFAPLVYGIDYAVGSVSASAAHNKGLLKGKRVVIKQASVSQLPFPDDFFDVVTAIETQYYWPDLLNDMREILRVLKPGGRLMVAVESYRGGKNDWLFGPVMRILGSQRLSAEEQRKLFGESGYVDMQMVEEERKGWLCAMGCKADRQLEL